MARQLKADDEIWDRKMTMAQWWAYEAWEGQELRPPCMLAEEYKWYAIVFDKKEATRFPPQRKEELSIELSLGAPKEINCKVYPLSWAEQDQLWTFLAEEAKEYIYKGSLPYTAPMSLIGKKDSNKWWMIIDYRKLNEWVVRDNGPLPNI